jgi:hypothetical protein
MSLSSTCFVNSEVTSSFVPGSASRFTVKKSWSVFGKKSFFKIQVIGRRSEIMNIHNTPSKNFIELFLFFMTFSRMFSYIISILSNFMNHLSRYFQNLDFFQPQNLSNVTAKAGFIVSAMTREESSVTVMMNGIENMNFQIIHVMKSIAEKIHTTVKVVEISTFL